jgi:hypothetical protein
MSHLSSVPSDPDALRAWLVQQGGVHVDALLSGVGNREVELPAPPDETRALTVDVTLLDAEPRVWRRLVVPGDTTLDRVHEVVQAAMGWTDSHLHRLYAGADRTEPHFVTEQDIEEGESGTPEREARLDQLLRTPGESILYEYDFGDGWEHELRLEGDGPLDEGARPRCIGGAGACPPENVGGIPGYDAVAAWVRSGRGPDDLPEPFESVDDAVAWLPSDWHPDAFDVEDTDLRVQAAAATGRLLEKLRPEALEAVSRLSPAGMVRVSEWLATAARASLSPADLDELTSPYRILLAAIDGGVQLTAAGYLPADLVRELCPALGVHPVLAGKANRESNARPLLMFRKAVQHTGLLHTSGGILTPTVAGIRYGDDPHGLWAHVAARLPAGKSELKVDAGWFSLLALAGGVDRRELYDVVHQLCVDAGWEDKDGRPVAYHVVNELVWPTQAALLGARWNALDDWPSWVPAAAASVIFTPAE